MTKPFKPNIINDVKKGLLDKKHYSTILEENGYTKATAQRGRANKVIKEAEAQLKSEYEQNGLTAEGVIRKKKEHYLECEREFYRAKSKEDKRRWGNQLNEVSDSILKYTVGDKLKLDTHSDYTQAELEEYEALKKRIFDTKQTITNTS